MPQNRETGARADKYGRETSQFIAKKIGAKAISSNSNAFAYQGRRVTIRYAHLRTHDVGVPYRMLDRIDSVIAAFEDKTGEYDLYEMSPASTRGRSQRHFWCFRLQRSRGLVRQLLLKKPAEHVVSRGHASCGGT